jgi:hypothetical protein
MKNNLKQLALKLYTYPESEQNWILENLDQVQRVQLQKVLHSLKQVNRFDAHIVNELLTPSSNDGDADDEHPDSDVADSYLQAVDKLPANKITAILNQEPAWFSSVLLGLHNWRWREEVTQSLKTEIRIAMQRLRYKENPALSPKLQSFLLSNVLDNARVVNDVAPAAWVTPALRRGAAVKNNIMKRMLVKLWR